MILSLQFFSSNVIMFHGTLKPLMPSVFLGYCAGAGPGLLQQHKRPFTNLTVATLMELQ